MGDSFTIEVNDLEFRRANPEEENGGYMMLDNHKALLHSIGQVAMYRMTGRTFLAQDKVVRAGKFRITFERLGDD